MKRIALAILALVGLTIAFAPLAFGATGAITVKQAALGQLLEMLIGIVGVALSVVVTFYVGKLLAMVSAKTGLKLGEAQRAQIDALLDRAIAYAEEQARKAVKAGNAKLTAGAKVEAAVSYFVSAASQYGAAEWAEGKVRDLLEAKLGAGRL